MSLRHLLRVAYGTALCFGFCFLCGCGGGAFTGSLTGRDGNGGGATASPGQAQVMSLSPSTILAASAAVTLTATGVNFTPTTTLMWNDSTPLATTYVSATTLRAVVPSPLIGVTGSATISPSPIGSFNFGTSFSVTPATRNGNKAFTVSKVSVRANDMVISPVSGRLYLAISSRSTQNPDTVIALDPQTGLFGATGAASISPGPLAVSADGAYLYAGMLSTFSVRRYLLPSLQPDIVIPLGNGGHANYTAGDLTVQPTDAHALAVARFASDINYPNQSDVAVYDDSVARAATASSGTNLALVKLLWNASGKTLYGIDSGTTTTLYNLSVDVTGVQLKTKSQVTASLTGSLHSDPTTGNLYVDSGSVLDPVTGATVATFPVNAIESGLTRTVMIPDGKLNIAYFLGHTVASMIATDWVIEAFDLTHYNLLGTATIPNVVGTPYKLVRWGSNGLAFLTTDTLGTSADVGVYSVSGGFVTAPAP
jgi:hypothetical protein